MSEYQLTPAMVKRDGSACRPICMSEDSFEFMQKSEGVDLNQMESYQALGMKS